MGPKPSWNPDGLGWRAMPAAIAKSYGQQFKSSFATVKMLAVAGTVLLKLLVATKV